MDAKFKAKILDAIDQSITHCRESFQVIDDPDVRSSLQELDRSLSTQRFEIASLQEDYPPDSDFHLEMTRQVDVILSLLTNTPQPGDMTKIKQFSALLSQYIDLGRS